MPLNFPEIESIRQRDPVLGEALQKLVSLVAPQQVNTSGKGNPNGVVRASVNTIFVQTDDTTGRPQWIKRGTSGTSVDWIQLSTASNIVSGEVPVDSGDHIHYMLAASPNPPSTLQLYINGARSVVKFKVTNRNFVFDIANSPTAHILVDYVK